MRACAPVGGSGRVQVIPPLYWSAAAHPAASRPGANSARGQNLAGRRIKVGIAAGRGHPARGDMAVGTDSERETDRAGIGVEHDSRRIIADQKNMGEVRMGADGGAGSPAISASRKR